MAKQSYIEKLKDPRWQKKRLECFDHYGWKCELCGETTRQLQVHHKEYIRGWEPWDYDFKQLAILCFACHELVTKHDPLTYFLSFVPMAGHISRDKLSFFMAGLVGMAIEGTPEEMVWFSAGYDLAATLDVYGSPSLPGASVRQLKPQEWIKQ